MKRLRGVQILDQASLELIYGPTEQRDIARWVDLDAPQTRESIRAHRDVLREIDVLFSGWGGPRVDEDFLDTAPNLKVIFYGAGSASSLITEEVWERGVQVTTAYAANAVPVAEYTLGAILLSLKHVWHLAGEARGLRRYPKVGNLPGCYGSTVGLVSLGMIARVLLRLLKPFDLKIIAYDPFLTEAQAAELEIESVGLEELFERSDVVSIHTPWLAETEGLITGAHVSAMKPGATLINTSRGAVVREAEMIEVASRRPDLQLILDVSHPEPPLPRSPLYTLPNVVLTPHIAGSIGEECRRMGRYMVEELER